MLEISTREWDTGFKWFMPKSLDFKLDVLRINDIVSITERFWSLVKPLYVKISVVFVRLFLREINKLEKEKD